MLVSKTLRTKSTDAAEADKLPVAKNTESGFRLTSQLGIPSSKGQIEAVEWRTMEDGVVSRLRPRRYERNGEGNSVKPKGVAKSNAERQREFRQRLKLDPEKYKEHRTMETLRVKLFRAELSDEKRKDYNEKTRQRMKRYRVRQTEMGKAAPSSNKNKTRASTQNQREKWRIQKQKQREAQTAQKKRRVNEKRRMNYAMKKNKQPSSIIDNQSIVSQSPFISPEARRQAVCRSMKILPKNPEKFADVLSKIIENSSPTRKSALKTRCIASPNSKRKLEFLEMCHSGFKEKLLELRRKRRKRDNLLRKLMHDSVAAKGRIQKKIQHEFGLSSKILSKLTKGGQIDNGRKKRTDALSDRQVQRITEFYQRSDISRELPNKQSIKKNLMVQKSLEGPLETVRKHFLEENPDIPISKSKFAKLRPQNVKTMNHTKYLQCLCEYCINMQFKLRSLSKFCASVHTEALAKDKYEVSRMTLCAKVGKHYQMACINRECRKCGTSLFRSKAASLLTKFGNSAINWQDWTQVPTVTSGANDETKKMYMSLVRKTGTIHQLIDQLVQDLEPFSKHLFNAQWQSRQFEHLKANIPEKWVLLCMDFGENYACRHQDEAQSAHWHYNQVTIHPVVAYYRCPDCNQPMHESIIFISEDHKHDQNAVQHFVTQSLEHLIARGLTLERVCQFSDGSPTQYKSKTNFADLSMSVNDFGVSGEKHFFGSRHGKGPCDGEIGVLKKYVAVAVGSRRAIVTNARDFFQFVNTELALPKDTVDHCHARRSFRFVTSGDINRNRQDRTADLKAVKNTRSSHCFRGYQPFSVELRERSCFCKICTGETITGTCEFQEITGDWTIQQLRGKAGTRGPRTRGGKMSSIRTRGGKSRGIGSGSVTTRGGKSRGIGTGCVTTRGGKSRGIGTGCVTTRGGKSRGIGTGCVTTRGGKSRGIGTGCVTTRGGKSRGIGTGCVTTRGGKSRGIGTGCVTTRGGKSRGIGTEGVTTRGGKSRGIKTGGVTTRGVRRNKTNVTVRDVQQRTGSQTQVFHEELTEADNDCQGDFQELTGYRIGQEAVTVEMAQAEKDLMIGPMGDQAEMDLIVGQDVMITLREDTKEGTFGDETFKDEMEYDMVKSAEFLRTYEKYEDMMGDVNFGEEMLMGGDTFAYEVVKSDDMMSDDIVVGDKTVRSDDLMMGDETVRSDDLVMGYETVRSDDLVMGDETVRSDLMMGDKTLRSDDLMGDETVRSDDLMMGDETVRSDDLMMGDETVRSDDLVMGDKTVRSDDLVMGDETVRSDDLMMGDKTVRSDDIVVGDKTVRSDDLMMGDETVRSDDLMMGDETVRSDDLMMEDKTVRSDDIVVGDKTVRSDDLMMGDETVRSDDLMMGDETVRSDLMMGDETVSNEMARTDGMVLGEDEKLRNDDRGNDQMMVSKTVEEDIVLRYVFVIVSYLIGVFVFATIVGQVGNVITNRNASRHDFERLLDGAKSYMRRHNVPKDMRKRVLRWYDYVWSRGRMDGSWDINSLGLLPDKLKTELAIHVNLETLKKVTIFQECQPEFLHDLVLKMKAYIFTPGDLICRHGEIAREMFIIADGVVEVISENGTVMTRMSTGDFFGEIGILNLDEGINRRTADVRSVGYSELFVLSRDDVLSALKDHPEAEKLLKDYGRQRLSVVRRLANMDPETERRPDLTVRSNSSPSLRVPMEDNPSPVTDLLSIHVPSTSCLRDVDPLLELQIVQSLEGCPMLTDQQLGVRNGQWSPLQQTYEGYSPNRKPRYIKGPHKSPRTRRRSRSHSTCSPMEFKGLMKVVAAPIKKPVPDIVVEPASPEKPTPPSRTQTGIPIVDRAVSLVETMFTEFWQETEKNYKDTVRSLESENRLKDMAITNLESKVTQLQFEIAQLQCRIMAERRVDKPSPKESPVPRQRSLPEKSLPPSSADSKSLSVADFVGEKKGTAV